MYYVTAWQKGLHWGSETCSRDHQVCRQETIRVLYMWFIVKATLTSGCLTWMESSSTIVPFSSFKVLGGDSTPYHIWRQHDIIHTTFCLENGIYLSGPHLPEFYCPVIGVVCQSTWGNSCCILLPYYSLTGMVCINTVMGHVWTIHCTHSTVHCGSCHVIL